MSAAVAAAAAAAYSSSRNTRRTTAQNQTENYQYSVLRRPAVVVSKLGGRYETQKRKDWDSFLEYLRQRSPTLVVSCCSGAHVIEFVKYCLDQKTRVQHTVTCPLLLGQSQSDPCPCPTGQVYWGSIDALIGRLRVAFEEMVGQAKANIGNPFRAPEVRLYLRQLKEDTSL
ncbi:hypothetical protein Ddye_029380 [Dipteronia dyeriana]|uniref:ALOG domain-containing protein n=1 Tax=Dipteronia dyeriana TaxID=168575 RepID=A0AAD9TF07_9ROSI|nr:hypothetical protein Ddye_029380 [Dipteronia dyeriana]